MEIYNNEEKEKKISYELCYNKHGGSAKCLISIQEI
jgi:hypothetical protein